MSSFKFGAFVESEHALYFRITRNHGDSVDGLLYNLYQIADGLDLALPHSRTQQPTPGLVSQTRHSETNTLPINLPYLIEKAL
jgi:hypothetical protein